MSRRNRLLGLLSSLTAFAVLSLGNALVAGGAEAKPATAGASGTAAGASSAETPRPKHPPFAELLKDATAIEGLLKLYRKDDRLFAELPGNLFDKDFIVLISIARGIGETPLVGGMSWGFGDDWLWQFRKVEDKVQIVRRNVRFTAAKGTPEERAVRLAYTDSVLFSLPVATTSPSGNIVVELTPVFMNDLPQISAILHGFAFARDRSSWARVKGFRDNVEIEVSATYASAGTAHMDTVADSRGVTLNIHYSLSLLPQTGYEPRVADDRVGYFVTAVKDFSKRYDSDRFVRYINRWDLRKADASADLSPPKKPIVFWLEKTIPWEFRKPIGEGILEWNKAYEKVGFANAIEVRQQPDDADWDPEDINYNTFRWITAGAGFAMGPSRVNPITGEILDADIIFDADFLSVWKDESDVLLPPRGEPTTAPALVEAIALPDRLRSLPPGPHDPYRCTCHLGRGISGELALSSLAIERSGKTLSREQFKKLVYQAAKSIAMHEVGHTLGLRHNFKASAYLTLDEINTPEKTKEVGLAASVMDYLPINVMPKGRKQGDYFSTTIGPYDYWAIEYGYKPLHGAEESAELKKIAARGSEPALAFATDEDCRSSDPDPLVNRYDLGKDLIEFAKMRRELAAQLIPGLVDRVTEQGESYQRTRQAFNAILSFQSMAMQMAARLVGGIYENRSHKGDPGAKPPFVIVEPARQREAMTLFQDYVFAEHAYEFPPELYNMLASSHWAHWGMRSVPRADYPAIETILAWQDRVLGQLLSDATLSRLVDADLKVPAKQEAFTAAEMFGGLTGAVFHELDRLQKGQTPTSKPAISSIRRALQRRYLERLGALAMGNAPAPDDCQTLAYAQLQAIEARTRTALHKAKLDPTSQAYLQEITVWIRKVLDAKMTLRSP